MSMSLSDKIAALRPNEPFWYVEETLDDIHFYNEDVKPVTQKELDQASSKLEYDYEYNLVRTVRRAQYQLISDPLFFGWQRGDNTEAEWLAAVDKIKADNPYPEVAN